MNGEPASTPQPLLDVLSAQSSANLAMVKVLSELMLGKRPGEQVVNELFDCIAAVNDATGLLLDQAKSALPGPEFGAG